MFEVNKKRLMISLVIVSAVVVLMGLSLTVKKSGQETKQAAEKFGKLPERPPVSSALPEGQTEAALSYNTNLIFPQFDKFKDEIVVYQGFPTLVDVKTLSQRLGFSGEPEFSEKTAAYTSPTSLLRFDEGRGFLEYYNNYGRQSFSKSPDNRDVDRLKAASGRFLIDQGLYRSADEFKEAKLTYYIVSGMEALPTNARQGADFIEISYSRLINGLPVLSTGSALYPTIVSLDFKGSVTSLRHYSFSVSEKEGSRYKLKDRKQVLAEIEAGKLTLVGFETGEITVPDFKSVVLTDVSLGYVLPTAANNIFYPVYVFSGEGQTAEKRSFEATFYLPAAEN